MVESNGWTDIQWYEALQLTASAAPSTMPARGSAIAGMDYRPVEGVLVCLRASRHHRVQASACKKQLRMLGIEMLAI